MSPISGGLAGKRNKKIYSRSPHNESPLKEEDYLDASSNLKSQKKVVSNYFISKYTYGSSEKPP